ncbi:MAG: SH3 domain-containing protein [Acidobacteria bacterium]|nr:MAG: SH3 domain-containing protein [Acidobacteriota bacterium]REK08346.1 MAG: SH3 domain-containing protein [Acidobacteriota bacterium]
MLEFRFTDESVPEVSLLRSGGSLVVTAEEIALAGRPDASSSRGFFRSVALAEHGRPGPLGDSPGFRAKIEIPADMLLTHSVGPGRLWLVACREVVASALGCPSVTSVQRAARQEAERRRRAVDGAAEAAAEEPANERPTVADRPARTVPEASAADVPIERRAAMVRSSAVRVGPGPTYDALATISAGMEVEILDEEAGWLSVRTSRATGWVPEADVRRAVPRPESSGEPAAAAPLAAAERLGGSMGITNNRVSLRAEPTVRSERLSVISAGRTLEILSERGLWLEVLIGGVRGWMFGEYVDRP